MTLRRPSGHRRMQRVAAAMLTASLLGAAPVAAQSPPSPPAATTPLATASAQAQSEQIQARMTEAARGLQGNPRLKNLSQQQREDLVAFVTGNMLFVMLHELSHAVVSEFDIPVLGRDEDAADDFAVLRGLNVGSEFSRRVLTEAARGWFYSDQRDRRDGEPLAFYDEHGLDKQRAYNIVCLMVGSDPMLFKDLANQTKLPPERQQTCPNDYKKVARAWQRMLQEHRRLADQPKINVDVIYGEGKGDLASFAAGFRAVHLLEIPAENAAESLAWKTPFTLEMKTCGFINAAWVADTRKLTLCYELAQDFAELFRTFNPAASVKTASAGKSKRKPK
jgi:Putative metallopeptidase